MNFYTAVLKKSGDFWVALCLENGLVGQGDSKEQAIEKLTEAVHSIQDVLDQERDVYSSAISITELHEFLTLEVEHPSMEPYELRAVNA
jgi:predicted RNase H-like HicB family nuclease